MHRRDTLAVCFSRSRTFRLCKGTHQYGEDNEYNEADKSPSEQIAPIIARAPQPEDAPGNCQGDETKEQPGNHSHPLQ